MPTKALWTEISSALYTST